MMPDPELAARQLMAVSEEELHRIVLDIHDGPVQNLFAALSTLTFLRSRMETRADLPPVWLAAVARAVALLERSLREIRLALTTFHAPEFAERDLAGMIEELAVDHEGLTGVAVALSVSRSLPQLSAVQKITVYRVVQEALSNIRRHAGIPDASISLAASADRFQVEIEDRGMGFRSPAGPGNHLGIRGMRERAAMINGVVIVESTPGAGTRVRMEIPVDG
jgi:signal transduction histidine kinase